VVRYAKTLVPFVVLLPTLFGFCLDSESHPIITVAPLSLAEGANGNVIVVMNQAASSDTVVSISTSAPSALQVPSNVDVPAGQTQVEFQVTASSSASGTATVTAGSNGTYTTSNSITFVP
jgi:GH25 family lysozyme M1 (1,4-beta-N-acetylmuramidase)